MSHTINTINMPTTEILKSFSTESNTSGVSPESQNYIDNLVDNLKSNFYKIIYSENNHHAHLINEVKKELRELEKELKKNNYHDFKLLKKVGLKNREESELFGLMIQACDSGDEEKINFFKAVKSFQEKTFTENERLQLNNYFSKIFELDKDAEINVNDINDKEKVKKLQGDITFLLDAKNKLDPKLYSKLTDAMEYPLNKAIQKLQTLQNFETKEDLRKNAKERLKKLSDTPTNNNNTGDNSNDIQAGNNLDLLNQKLNDPDVTIWEIMMVLSLIEYNLSASQALHVAQDSKGALQRSHDAQEMSNRINEKIANLKPNEPTDTAKVEKELIDEMRRLGITVDGKSIDDYIKDKQKNDDGSYSLDRAALDAIKGACDQVVTTSNQSSTEAQIKITQANNGATNWLTLAKTMLSSWSQLMSRIVGQ